LLPQRFPRAEDANGRVATTDPCLDRVVLDGDSVHLDAPKDLSVLGFEGSGEPTDALAHGAAYVFFRLRELLELRGKRLELAVDG
jgi:hypothetical protein